MAAIGPQGRQRQASGAQRWPRRSRFPQVLARRARRPGAASREAGDCLLEWPAPEAGVWLIRRPAAGA
jgi:hypothetical protein